MSLILAAVQCPNESISVDLVARSGEEPVYAEIRSVVLSDELVFGGVDIEEWQ